MSAAPSNLRPYTVSPGRKGSLDVNLGGQIVAKLVKTGANPEMLAALLNDAYEAGVKTENDRCQLALNGLSVPECFVARSLIRHKVAAASPIPITPETVIPFPCWIYWSGAIGPRWSRQQDYLTREELEALAATHYLPDQPDMPTQVP